MRRTSRRLATLAIAVLASALTAPIASAVVEEFMFADSFPEQSYEGNTGTLDWTGPWKEIGEEDGPKEGAVQVYGSNCSGKCLVLDTGLVELAQTIGLSRVADLAEASGAELYFEMKRQPGLAAVGKLHVEIVKAGKTYPLANFSLSDTDDGLIGKTIPIDGFVGHEIAIVFRIGAPAINAKVSIDNVEIGVQYEPEPSTTTTTKATTTTTKATTTTSEATTTTTAPPTTTSTSEAIPTTSSTTTSTTLSVVVSDPDPSPPQPLEASAVTRDFSPIGDTRFDQTFALSPLTSLTASFRSVVEAVQGEFVSALGLGLLVSFFALRLPKDPDDEEDPAS